jgi:hypothetical protein
LGGSGGGGSLASGGVAGGVVISVMGVTCAIFELNCSWGVTGVGDTEEQDVPGDGGVAGGTGGGGGGGGM